VFINILNNIPLRNIVVVQIGVFSLLVIIGKKMP